MKKSDCCGAVIDFIEGGEETGICPLCKEHCEWIDFDDEPGSGSGSLSGAGFDLVLYLAQQSDWSTKTFGPGPRLLGIAEHVSKELAEVTGACTPQEAMEEWCDIAILALDGAWRAGFTPAQVCEQMRRKQAINFRRQWPPPGPQDRATEHVRRAV